MATFLLLLMVFGCGALCGAWLGHEIAKAPLMEDED